MAVVKELIRTEADGSISFGNHRLETKQKVEDFEHDGDQYKVKTFKTMTKLERNGLFVYESVPGTAVFSLKQDGSSMEFEVEGAEDAQITVEMEADTEYSVSINGEDAGKMQTNLGGKLSFSVELDEARGQILGRGLGLGLRLLPLVAAELVEPDGRILTGADILADKIELRGRDVQAVRALIGDLDVILRHAADLQLLHADVAADTVVLVDDEVPGREVGERIELFAVRGLFRGARFLPLLPDGDLPLC